LRAWLSGGAIAPQGIGQTARGCFKIVSMNKVFVAQDLLPFIEEQRSILNRANVRLFTAPTAEEAMELHRRERMDLIIADLNMPSMGGDGLCSAIRQDESLGKVYFILICSGETADLRRCETCGANSFIARPFDFEEIADRVGRLLQIPRRQDVRVLVKVTVHGQFRAEPFFCTSRDISVSGILIDTEKTLARGDLINCSFYLPNADRVSVEGEVVRILRGSASAYSYGVRFVAPGPEARMTIERYIASED